MDKHKTPLTEAIMSEDEHKAVEKTAEQIAAALTAKIKSKAGAKLNSALMVVVSNGQGKDLLVLADPKLKDFILELQRYADAGEDSPLGCLLDAYQH